MPNSESDKKLALDYHELPSPGKSEVVSTKPTYTSRDLSLAYSPGVAYPCLEIALRPDDVYRYTNKGNLVAVISNGTAVLGLGSIGALASKPVMEGKGVLFKRFADIDVFDIEIEEQDVEKFITAVKALEPTFGGVNLEDIKAPECFEIEKRLTEEMEIPVFHDDQHGTAIIATAGLINCLGITKRDANTIKVVFSGAGAAAMAIANMFYNLGVKKENLIMCDSKGVIYSGRTDGMNPYKEIYAVETEHRTLADAMNGADVFIGCSKKGLLTKDMVKTMAKNPIIFAMANPEPEIMPEEVAQVRNDAIMATGRSDYPNQVNNVLCFPFMFRGALDVRAKGITEEMKLAAAEALADLAREEVPEDVKRAYGNEEFVFGPKYIIPKPFDKRVLSRVAPAVAKAAIESGVAREKIEDIDTYALNLDARLGNSGSFMRSIQSRVSNLRKPKIVFSEGHERRVLEAAAILKREGAIEPILLDYGNEVPDKIKKYDLKILNNVEIIQPEKDQRFRDYVDQIYVLRQRRGTTRSHARQLMTTPDYFASMMLKQGDVDGMITGATQNYADCIKPILNVLGTRDRAKAAGIIILIFKQKVVFLADCTAQFDPTPEDLSEIARSSANLFRNLMRKEPNIAFLSFSNFGSSGHPMATKMAKAATLTKEKYPELIVDGEMQADVAVNASLLDQVFDFNKLNDSADILIFPDLNSANISYKLLRQLGEATPVGPILVPMDYAANIVQRTATVEEIVHMSHLTALIAREKMEN